MHRPQVGVCPEVKVVHCQAPRTDILLLLILRKHSNQQIFKFDGTFT